MDAGQSESETKPILTFQRVERGARVAAARECGAQLQHMLIVAEIHALVHGSREERQWLTRTTG